MSTEAQITANRQNAQKSTGPRTTEGKTIASQNSTKHGLSASLDVISSENQADFDLYRDSIIAELKPSGPMESTLAERIVSLCWRLKRTSRIQNQVIDAMNAKDTSDPFAKITKSLLRQYTDQSEPASSTPDPDLTLGRLAMKDFANSRVLDRLMLYERRLEHCLYKTLLELQRLQLIRKLDPLTSADKETVFLPKIYEKLH
jgi:hypothetical protein